MTTHAPHPIQDEAGHNEDLVAGATLPPPPTVEERQQIDRLYDDFDAEHLMPLWTQLSDLMPLTPQPVRCRTCGAGRRCYHWRSGPVPWSRSARG